MVPDSDSEDVDMEQEMPKKLGRKKDKKGKGRKGTCLLSCLYLSPFNPLRAEVFVSVPRRRTNVSIVR